MDEMLASKRFIYVASAIGIGASAYAAAKYFSRGGGFGFYSARQDFHAMDDYPDLRHHNNCMANHLSPRLYTKLKSVSTPNGFTLDQAIQTGRFTKYWRARAPTKLSMMSYLFSCYF